MKIFFLILVWVFMVGTLWAVQPARKPFLQITIDGDSYKSGDILTVKPGQKLVISVRLEGGRRDFCKFPDTYADIAGTAQILSRGDDGLSYELNGTKAEWKLLSEDAGFSGDKFVRINNQANKSSAEITITDAKFTQSFLKVSVKATWQFSQN